RGEVIQIKTLISHIMETGFRHDNVGRPIPRDIITSFVCTYNGEEIFKAALYQAIAANPFITFHTLATESGSFAFQWTGDHGDAKPSMKGVAARYPAFDAASGRPVNFEQRINLSRQQDQKAQPFVYESKEMVALSAYVALQSRGEPIEANDDPRLAPFIDKG